MIGLARLFRRRPEVRESYADQVVSRIIASAGESSDGRALAAIETAARLVGCQVLASAAVKPFHPCTRGLSLPSVLDAIGRALCRVRGKRCILLTFANGRVMLTPCAQSWTVHGSDPKPASWEYLCVVLNGPRFIRDGDNASRGVSSARSDMPLTRLARGAVAHRWLWLWIRQGQRDGSKRRPQKN